METAIIKNTLIVKPVSGGIAADKSFKPTQIEAWQVTTSLWNILADDSSTNMKETYKSANRLHDIVHGIGAVACGSIIAPILVTYYHLGALSAGYTAAFSNSTAWKFDWHFFVAMVVSVLFAGVAFRNLYVTTQHAISFVKIMLWTRLDSTFGETKTVLVSESMFR